MNAAQNIVRDEIDEALTMEARLAKLESDVEHIKAGVQSLHEKISAANDATVALKNEVSHLATKEDLSRVEGKLTANIGRVEGKLTAHIGRVEGELKASINKVEGELKASINKVEGELKASISSFHGALDARINAMESKIQRWVVGTGLGAAALALAVARFVHLPAGDPSIPSAAHTVTATEVSLQPQTKNQSATEAPTIPRADRE